MITRTLFDWYITRHAIHTAHEIKLEKREYLGKNKCFYVAHGSLTQKVNDPIRTSVLKQLEFTEDDACLRVYTQNSIYVCPLKECRKDKQEPFEILPVPVQAIAEAKLHPIISGPEKNSITLAFDDNDRNSYFFDAVFNREGKTSQLYPFSFKDYGDDEIILSDNAIWHKKINIQFCPVASRQGRFIEFGKFHTDGLAAYLFNVGDKPLSFLTVDGFIDLAPGEKKRVAKDNVAADSKERLVAYKEKICP